MQITGNQLIFLIEVLKDSLEIQNSYDWNFKHKLISRKDFHQKLINFLLGQEIIDVQDIDLSKI